MVVHRKNNVKKSFIFSSSIIKNSSSSFPLLSPIKNSYTFHVSSCIIKNSKSFFLYTTTKEVYKNLGHCIPPPPPPPRIKPRSNARVDVLARSNVLLR